MDLTTKNINFKLPCPIVFFQELVYIRDIFVVFFHNSLPVNISTIYPGLDKPESYGIGNEVKLTKINVRI